LLKSFEGVPKDVTNILKKGIMKSNKKSNLNFEDDISEFTE